MAEPDSFPIKEIVRTLSLKSAIDDAHGTSRLSLNQVRMPEAIVFLPVSPK
jgi:hypothetical protein